jgi:hypothetical protein
MWSKTFNELKTVKPTGHAAGQLVTKQWDKCIFKTEENNPCSVVVGLQEKQQGNKTESCNSERCHKASNIMGHYNK